MEVDSLTFRANVLREISHIAAVVLPKDCETTHDVFPASAHHTVTYSLCPLGLSFFGPDPDYPSQIIRHTLIYVSEQAARDRDRRRNSMNFSDVLPGWYLIAEPGPFEIHVSQVNHDRFGSAEEDVISYSLEIEGQKTRLGHCYAQPDEDFCDCMGDEISDVVVRGFLERSDKPTGDANKSKKSVRPFLFAGTPRGDGLDVRGGNPNLGSIKLKVFASGLRVDQPEKPQDGDIEEGLPVLEAVSLDPDGVMKDSKGLQLTNLRSLPNAEVTVYLRERWWLRSRKLIDFRDKPINLYEFRLMTEVEHFYLNQSRPGWNTINYEEEQGKRRKIEGETGSSDDVQPLSIGEKVDIRALFSPCMESHF